MKQLLTLSSGLATIVFTFLKAAQPALSMAAGECNLEFVRRIMVNLVAKEPLATLDYAEVRPDRLLIAARVGAVRLIDNLEPSPRKAAG